jgi:penicillin amidase
MRVFKWIFGILLGLILVICVCVYAYLRSTLPDYNGEIVVPEIGKPVDIIRDSYGMPHIYAQTDADAYFALGYCMAQDRLFHMDLMRRAARGKLAEIFGKDLVPVDRFFRTITAGKSIEEIAAAYKPETISAAKAYAAGVNYFIKHHKGPLPLEFTILGYEPEPWQPSDATATQYIMAEDLNTAFSVELLHAAVIEKVGEEMAQEIFPDYVDGYPTIVPQGSTALEFLKTLNLAREIRGAEGGGASNSWVVSGKKSTNGKPILANDPHLGHRVPGIWYEAHLVSPSMNVSGTLLPGLPFVIIGANEHVAWGFTNVMADDADFYIEKINPANPNQSEFMGRWEDMTIKEEVIKVKGADDVKFKIRLTRHGPIIDEINTYNEPKNTVIAMRWTAYELGAWMISKKRRSISNAPVKTGSMRMIRATLGFGRLSESPFEMVFPERSLFLAGTENMSGKDLFQPSSSRILKIQTGVGSPLPTTSMWEMITPIPYLIIIPCRIDLCA